MKRAAYILLIASALVVACGGHPDDLAPIDRSYRMMLDTVQGHVYITTTYHGVSTIHAAHCRCQTKEPTP